MQDLSSIVSIKLSGVLLQISKLIDLLGHSGELLHVLGLSCRFSRKPYFIVTRSRMVRKPENIKEANKQAEIYVGGHLTRHIFCFRLIDYVLIT